MNLLHGGSGTFIGHDFVIGNYGWKDVRDYEPGIDFYGPYYD
jgi:hypothetical protein